LKIFKFSKLLVVSNSSENHVSSSENAACKRLSSFTDFMRCPWA
jgi:hypothetical protein